MVNKINTTKNFITFSALTLMVWRQERHPACKKMGGWWRWTLVSPDGMAPSQTIGVSVSVNLPLHHKVQKFSSGTGSPVWSRKNGRKMVVVGGGKNFNAGAIITTPRGNSLHRTRHTMYGSLRSGHPFFTQLTVLPNPKILCFTMLFSCSN